MAPQTRVWIEQWEREHLSPYAARSCESQGREEPVEDDPVRTCYMRDRDRILHSKSFRRLKHKTQVFITPAGDHYRTRLTHTLEVAQIARTVARSLRLNEDLTEAISLGHDVGHTPFGHAGESALDQSLREKGIGNGFRHYEQSLRVVDVLEHLNLTAETRAGIGGHSKGRNDLTAHDGVAVSTLEAAIVRIADRVAYLNHDLDDAMRSGIVEAAPSHFLEVGASHGTRIGAMVCDIIENSLDKPAVQLSPRMLALMNDLKEWLFENVYNEYPRIFPEIPKAKHVVTSLFEHFMLPENAPEGFVGVQGALDYVAGMTDRFAIDTYVRLFVPEGFAITAQRSE